MAQHSPLGSMKGADMESIWVICAIAVYGVLPVLLIWGWIRWAISSQPRTVPAIMAFVSFLLTTLSVLLALGTAFYARVVRSGRGPGAGADESDGETVR